MHPAYPVFDRKRFATLYNQGQASPLVLHAIFLLGFTVGSDSLVQAAGYSSRATARRHHYLCAKALYDADYDSDRSNIVACLLLMGFWWSGPEDQKDTCYWVGCATNIAQSTGMHRSTTDYGMSPSVRSLWKRIWWSIYIRDRHTAAAFGRPCRIQDEDCDVETPTAEDFSFDEDYDQSLITPQRDYHVSYFLEMTKLTNILGDVLKAEFSPRRPALEKFKTEVLADRLAQWESHLPNPLRSTVPDGSLGVSFWASMLQFSYQ
ncbi:fungal-specific transcription factor domain-containing protein [Penicillium brevicompactum]|uniref:Fungal-specific transcription factor domain-containing protein n=1 Tax=Penicillium brevicompactum TaxID=5074 RepID=A0A9W9QSR6_PENBR|nr:fungal-specific transcription factor domain-containing protein [Penicillium brevicompactum]